MINFETEYFSNPYYFFLKRRNNGDISLYYSSSMNTLSESRKNDKKIDLPKSAEKDLKMVIKKLMSSKKKSKKQIESIINRLIKKYKKKKGDDDGELTELINADGSFSNSDIPMLDMGQHTHWTQDMRAALVRQAGDQFPFKARVYYGESKEDKKVLDEEDFSDAYGYEEIIDDNIKTFKDCYKIFDDLEIKDPFEKYERCMSFGFDPELDEDGQQRIVELRKEKMRNLIDELLLKNKNETSEIQKSEVKDEKEDSIILKLLFRNLDSIKKIAEKEGVDINKLVKHLKVGE